MTKGIKISWIATSIIASIIIVFLSEWIQKEGIIYFPMGFRHLIIIFIFVVNWIFYGRKLQIPKNYKLALFAIFSFLLIARMFSPAPLFNYLLGIGFTFLFVIMFILGSNTKSSTKVIERIFKGILVFFLLMSIFSIFQALLGEISLRWVPTMFRELGAYAAAMNIGTIISLTMYIITSKKHYLYLAFFFSFAVLLTILKKTIISNIIVWLAFYFFHNSSKNKIKLILYSMIFITIGYFAVGEAIVGNLYENINYFESAGSEKHVRIAMYIASYNIATDYFPFGSGMGTFGSLSSIIGGYSPLYMDYGVSNIGSNSQVSVAAGHHTLLDTYWPHILGEFGIFGSFLFLYLWLFPARLSVPILRSSKVPFLKGLSFYITLILITMTWEGFSLYTPEIPSFIILHSGLTGLCYYHIKYHFKNNYETT